MRPIVRHARACPGHPRHSSLTVGEDVDGRDKLGHDDERVSPPPSLCRASLAPAPSAISLASAISRRIGAMPQLVVATILLFGTNFETASITFTTSSAVSI